MTTVNKKILAVFVLVAATGLAEAAQEWFDEYEAGVAALDRGEAARAVAHLERAIRGRDEPGDSIITYGTNRMATYHPYLKLAEAHLLAGHLEGAKSALRRSAERGKEPADRRAALMARVEAAERAQVAPTPAAPVAAHAPPTSTVAPAPTTTLPAAVPPPSTVAPVPVLIAPPPPVVAVVPTPAPSVARHASHPALPEATPAPDPISLVVFSDPPGATVYLDDEPLGDTDPTSGRLVKTGIAPGSHRLRLGKEGRSDATREVTVAEAGPTEVRVSLASAAPVPVLPPFLSALLVTAVVGLLLFGWQRLRGGRGTARPTPTISHDVTRARPDGTAVDPLTLGSGDLVALGSRPAVAMAGVGEHFGEYLLKEQLGKGGMAAVFLAERGGELVALKRPLGMLLEEPEFRERFLREAEIGRTLHHPNIIRIFERGDVGGVPYFTMELVKGQTLQARVREQGAFSPREACGTISQVAEALDYAHLKGVVHRDLKPSNIMIQPDGTVKVMDYGIARARRFEGMTLTGAFLGTPDYVAPETAEGRGTDARSDLYSLGIVFYEILTGRKPFVADTPFATLRKQVSEAPTPPSVHMPDTPKELEAIVLKLLAKDPKDRYAGAEELLIALRTWLNRAA